MELTQEQIDVIRKISYPLVSYMKTLGNPDLKILIDDLNVEVLEGIALIKERRAAEFPTPNSVTAPDPVPTGVNNASIPSPETGPIFAPDSVTLPDPPIPEDLSGTFVAPVEKALIDKKFKILAVNPWNNKYYTEGNALLLCAKDKAVPAALKAYAQECKKLGSSELHISNVELLIERVVTYQTVLGSSVPDTEVGEVG